LGGQGGIGYGFLGGFAGQSGVVQIWEFLT
jgi:hypothetical protein